MSNDKTFMDDRESLQALIECLPKAERDQYQSYGALMLESGFPNRKLILYTVRDGKPTEITFLTLGKFSMDSFAGPVIELLYDDKSTTTIEMVPKRFLDKDIFFHIPQKFELKWKGKHVKGGSGKVAFVPHYAVLIKSRSKPHMNIEGHTYCVRMNDFRERFPESTVRY